MTITDILILLFEFVGFIALLCVLGYWAFVKWKQSEDRKAERFRDKRS